MKKKVARGLRKMAEEKTIGTGKGDTRIVYNKLKREFKKWSKNNKGHV